MNKKLEYHLLGLYLYHHYTSSFAMSAEASSSGSTSVAHASVLMPSEELPNDAVHVKGPDLSNPITLEDLLKSYETIGFQATGLARATQVVEEMVSLSTSLKCKLTNRGNAGPTQNNH